MSKSILVLARSLWTGVPGTPPSAPGAVAVNGSRIVAVGHPAELLPRYAHRRNTTVLDLGDLYLLPGLINTHVHLTLNAGPDPVTNYQGQTEFQLLLRATANARRMLMSGVTTIRDCGSRGHGLAALLSEETATEHTLPTVLASGPPLTPTGGHLHWMGGACDGAEEIRARVRRHVSHGLNTLKIVATGGQMTPGTRPEFPSYTLRELRTATAEARRLGLTTCAHCLCAAGIRLAAQAGVGCIEHAAFFKRDADGRLVREFDPEAARMLASSGTYVAPTLSAGYHRLDPVRSNPNPDLEGRFRLDQETLMLEHCGRMAALGISLVVGTDAGVTLTPFDETWLELALMVRAGLTSEQALLAATYLAADALGLKGRKGVVQPGADADLIACKEDPLTDVRALSAIEWVMKGGRVVHGAPTSTDQEAEPQ